MQVMERRCDTRASVSLMGRVPVDESESTALLLGLSCYLPSGQQGRLRLTVRAACGASALSVCDWEQILTAANAAPNGHVIVGSMPSGRHVSHPGRDHLDDGSGGRAAVVHTRLQARKALRRAAGPAGPRTAPCP